MKKQITSLMMTATMMMALSAQAQVAKQTFRRSAATAQQATLLPMKGEHNPQAGAMRQLSAQQLTTAKQAGDKQMLHKQKAGKPTS